MQEILLHPPIFGGVLDSSRLRFIADVAEEFGGVRVIFWQNVVFVDVDDVQVLKERLAEKFELKQPRMHLACA